MSTTPIFQVTAVQAYMTPEQIDQCHIFRLSNGNIGISLRSGPASEPRPENELTDYQKFQLLADVAEQLRVVGYPVDVERDLRFPNNRVRGGLRPQPTLWVNKNPPAAARAAQDSKALATARKMLEDAGVPPEKIEAALGTTAQSSQVSESEETIEI